MTDWNALEWKRDLSTEKIEFSNFQNVYKFTLQTTVSFRLPSMKIKARMKSANIEIKIQEKFKSQFEFYFTGDAENDCRHKKFLFVTSSTYNDSKIFR